MIYQEIIDLLKENADSSYAKFHSSLNADGDGLLYGVRVPILRNMSKNIVSDNPIEFINNIKLNSYEERVLYGMVISQLKIPIHQKLDLFTKFIEVINSWAVCDVVSLKVPSTEKEILWNFVTPYFNSTKEFYVRFAIINTMQNFINDDYIDKVLEIYENIDSSYYYVNMAAAWAVQKCFVKYKEKTYQLFEKGKLSTELKNKAIQKIRDSRVVSLEDKENILKYKSI